MRGILVSGLAASLLGCAGKPVLNEANAKTQIEAALRTESYMASINALSALMSRSTTDYKITRTTDGTATTLSRLIAAGFVQQTVHTDRYPVISGTWDGSESCPKSNEYMQRPVAERIQILAASDTTVCQINRDRLQLQTLANSNNITGTGVAMYGGRPLGDPNSISGTVGPDGVVRFTVQGYWNGVANQGTYTYAEAKGKAYLVSNGDGGPGVIHPTMLYVGTPSNQSTELKSYEYSFVPSVRLGAGTVVTGQYSVGAISNLRLELETQASANFEWRVSLDSLGRILVSEGAPSGIGTAQFVKKPDGTWVLAAPIRFQSN
jgi:hypothetical protein